MIGNVPIVHVMVGALADAQGRILVARRPEHVHQGGLWEFPGGKLEPGETPEQGLARELAEELGIRVLASRPLIRVHHDYGDRRVLLDTWRVERHLGEPQGREGQPLAWRHPDDLDPADFPAADRPILSTLRLPPLLLITGADPARPEAFLARLESSLAAGIRLVQLRAHGLADLDYARLATAAFARCERFGARLLLNRDPARLAGIPRHGLHLSARALAAGVERLGAGDGKNRADTDRSPPPFSLEGVATSSDTLNARTRPLRHPGADERPKVDGSRSANPMLLLGASCHDADDLRRAARLGCDYAVLSPVKPTATHPEARPLGWPRFAALVEAAPLPVYALGGLEPADLEEAWRHGAQGIAAIRGLWPPAPPAPG